MHAHSNHDMKRNRPVLIAWAVLLFVLLLTIYAARHPLWIETVYSRRWYPRLGFLFRLIWGSIPFSVGDLLVALGICWLLFKSITSLYRIIVQRRKPPRVLPRIFYLIFITGWIYVLFHWCWGLNYYRLGTAYQFNLEAGQYSTADVDTLLGVMQQRITHLMSDSNHLIRQRTSDRAHLGEQALQTYQQASDVFPFLKLRYLSLKANLLGPLQSYTGYSGYLFPFTGESQVNFYAPSFTLPFTVCHEMAHQLGYGMESEANLVAFLACRQSPYAAFQYSAYADMYGYALAELWERDTLKAKALAKVMPPMLREDRMELAGWIRKHRNPVQRWIDWVYERYLYQTRQPMGLKSYNRVVAWLIAYGKRYGWASL